MSYRREILTNYFLADTPVENLFIAEYLPAAPENAVKVYLFSLMHAEHRLPLDDAAAAKELGISAEDVESAWAYWEEQGLVSRSRDGVEFLSIKEKVFGRRSEASRRERKAALMLDDKALSKLYREIEGVTGRLLEASEPEKVARLITDYGMEPELILFGYRFCSEKRRSSRAGYVERVLKDWVAQGLSTKESVEEHLADTDRQYELYRTVFRELGFHRSPSEPEKKIMDSWTQELGFGLNRIMEACRKTTGINSPNINYVNSVLRAWKNDEQGGTKPAADLISRIGAAYEKIREENSRRTESARREIFLKAPRLMEISEELKKLSMESSKAMLMGGGGKKLLAGIRERSAALVRERDALLAENGYPADALSPVYSCAECRDTGLKDDGSRCSCYSRIAQMVTMNE